MYSICNISFSFCLILPYGRIKGGGERIMGGGFVLEINETPTLLLSVAIPLLLWAF